MTKKERNELIYARHQEGYSQEEIGRFYNLSQSAISLIILNKKRNVPEKEEETCGAFNILWSRTLMAQGVITDGIILQSKNYDEFFLVKDWFVPESGGG
ncbi:MAG: hypothetical protein HRU12_20440 [Phaeodactylibacter sp.]|nr:hypothetical protein [Phaeodactylibacter sp.]